MMQYLYDLLEKEKAINEASLEALIQACNEKLQKSEVLQNYHVIVEPKPSS